MNKNYNNYNYNSYTVGTNNVLKTINIVKVNACVSVFKKHI